MFVNDIKLADKTETTEPTWKFLLKVVDFGEPTSFLDLVYLGCKQRECKISNGIVASYRDMFESRVSEGATDNCRPAQQGNVMQKISSWSYDMEGHVKICVERDFEFANKTTQHFVKVATPCMDDHQIKQENESGGELSVVCSQIVLKCVYLARVGRFVCGL